MIKTKIRSILSWLLPLIVVGLMAYLASANWYQIALIQGDSMRPTYKPLEFVIIDKTVTDYRHTDVVAVSAKRTGGEIIKRIVALPTDTVIIRDGVLYVNGIVSDMIKPEQFIEYPGIARTEICLTDDEYFLMGDNLQESHDSRYSEIGSVKRDDILGRIIPNKPLNLS